MPTGCINIFSSASADIGIDPIFAQMCCKCFDLIFTSIFKIGKRDRIVFDDVHLTWNMPAEFYQFFGIRNIIIEIIENNVFVGNRIFGF